MVLNCLNRENDTELAIQIYNPKRHACTVCRELLLQCCCYITSAVHMHCCAEYFSMKSHIRAQTQNHSHMARLQEQGYMYSVFKRAVDTDKNSTCTQHPIFLQWYKSNGSYSKYHVFNLHRLRLVESFSWSLQEQFCHSKDSTYFMIWRNNSGILGSNNLLMITQEITTSA